MQWWQVGPRRLQGQIGFVQRCPHRQSIVLLFFSPLKEKSSRTAGLNPFLFWFLRLLRWTVVDLGRWTLNRRHILPDINVADDQGWTKEVVIGRRSAFLLVVAHTNRLKSCFIKNINWSARTSYFALTQLSIVCSGHRRAFEVQLRVSLRVQVAGEHREGHGLFEFEGAWCGALPITISLQLAGIRQLLPVVTPAILHLLGFTLNHRFC